MDALIGTRRVNQILGRADSPDAKTGKEIEAALQACGVDPVGKGISGMCMWSENQVSGAKDEVNKWLANVGARQSPLPLEGDIENIVSEAMRASITTLQRYIDSSLSQVDEELSKIHQCAQQDIRLTADIQNNQKALLALQKSVATDVTEAVNGMKEGVKTELRRLEGALDKKLSGVREELEVIRLMVKEIGK